MNSRIVGWQLLCAVAICIFTILLVGCGGPESTVTGKVVYEKDGSPMTAGMVMFVSAEGQRLARGDIGSDGSYRLRSKDREEGLQPGKYLVCVVPPDTSSQRENGIITPPVLDERFLSTQTSGLEFEVQPGANDFTVKVSKPSGG